MTNDKLLEEVAEAIAEALDLAISERAKPLDIDYIRDAAQAAIDVMQPQIDELVEALGNAIPMIELCCREDGLFTKQCEQLVARTT